MTNQQLIEEDLKIMGFDDGRSIFDHPRLKVFLNALLTMKSD